LIPWDNNCTFFPFSVVKIIPESLRKFSVHATYIQEQNFMKNVIIADQLFYENVT